VAKIKLTLIRNDKSIKTIVVDPDKVGKIAMLVYEGVHYHYHRLVSFGLAEFMECDPPLNLDGAEVVQ
jgi:hypothetical protein